TLKGMTPYQFIVKSWGDNPDVFLDEPCHLNLGLYTYLAQGFRPVEVFPTVWDEANPCLFMIKCIGERMVAYL
ncbi:MAG: hypothetical protein FWC70_01795, partial [Defluviitaleaceae bacterium]|nr:hypothetical protein [Defluviitaleaceae bacterium]